MLLRNATQPWSSIQWESGLSCAESLCSRLRKRHRLWNVLTAAFIPRFSHKCFSICQECELSPSISPCISSAALEVWKLLYSSSNTSYRRQTVFFQENRRYSIWLSFWMTFFIWNSLRGADCFGFPLLVSGWRNRIAVPVMGFSLPSTTSANDCEGKWRGEGEKIKPILHQLAISRALTAL